MNELDYPDLKFDGKTVSEYEIDLFSISDNELNPTELLFTYAKFENGKRLTDNQLRKLSKQYPEIIYLLINDLLPEDSIHHATYQPMLVDTAGEY